MNMSLNDRTRRIVKKEDFDQPKVKYEFNNATVLLLQKSSTGNPVYIKQSNLMQGIHYTKRAQRPKQGLYSNPEVSKSKKSLPSPNHKDKAWNTKPKATW